MVLGSNGRKQERERERKKWYYWHVSWDLRCSWYTQSYTKTPVLANKEQSHRSHWYRKAIARQWNPQRAELKKLNKPHSARTFCSDPSPCIPDPTTLRSADMAPLVCHLRRSGLGGFVREEKTCCIEWSLAQRERRACPSLHLHLPGDLSKYRIQYRQIPELLSHRALKGSNRTWTCNTHIHTHTHTARAFMDAHRYGRWSTYK